MALFSKKIKEPEKTFDEKEKALLEQLEMESEDDESEQEPEPEPEPLKIEVIQKSVPNRKKSSSSFIIPAIDTISKAIEGRIDEVSKSLKQ